MARRPTTPQAPADHEASLRQRGAVLKKMLGELALERPTAERDAQVARIQTELDGVRRSLEVHRLGLAESERRKSAAGRAERAAAAQRAITGVADAAQQERELIARIADVIELQFGPALHALQGAHHKRERLAYDAARQADPSDAQRVTSSLQGLLRTSAATDAVLGAIVRAGLADALNPLLAPWLVIHEPSAGAVGPLDGALHQHDQRAQAAVELLQGLVDRIERPRDPEPAPADQPDDDDDEFDEFDERSAPVPEVA